MASVSKPQVATILFLECDKNQWHCKGAKAQKISYEQGLRIVNSWWSHTHLVNKLCWHNPFLLLQSKVGLSVFLQPCQVLPWTAAPTYA